MSTLRSLLIITGITVIFPMNEAVFAIIGLGLVASRLPAVEMKEGDK